MVDQKKKSYNKAYYESHRKEMIESERARRRKPEYIIKERERYKRRRESVLAQKKEYHKEHRDHLLAKGKLYYNANKQTFKEKTRIYRQKNIRAIVTKNGIYCKKNRSKVNAWMAKWRANNPGRVTAYEARRRVLELSMTVDANACSDFYSWVRNQDFVTCTYCGSFISGKGIEIDHIVPITRGGAHDPDNFCVSCRSCNASKSDKMLHEWTKCPDKFRCN